LKDRRHPARRCAIRAHKSEIVDRKSPIGMRLTLRSKILLAFVAILLPLLALETVGLVYMYRTREEGILDGYRQLAQVIAAQVDHFFTDLAGDGALAGELALSRPGPRSAMADGLARARTTLRGVDQVVLHALDGSPLAADPPPAPGPGMAGPGGEAFRRVLGGAAWAASDLVPGARDGPPFIFVAVGLNDRGGRARGVLVLRVGAPTFGKLFPVPLRPGELLTLFDRAGRLVYWSREPDLPWERRDFSADPLVRRALAGQPAASGDHPSVDRAFRLLAARVPVRSAGWVVGVAAERGVALWPVRRGLLLAGVLLAAATVISAGLAWAVGSRIVRSLDRLRVASRQVSLGDLSPRLAARGHDEVAALEESFNQMAAALTEARAGLERQLEATEAKAGRLQLLNALSRELTSTLDLDALFRVALDRVLLLTGGDVGLVRLAEPDPSGDGPGVLVVRAHRGVSAAYLERMARIPLGRAVAGRVAITGEPMVVETASAEPETAHLALLADRARSLACFPLRAKARTIGTLTVSSPPSRGFDAGDLELVGAVASLLATAADNARLLGEARTAAAGLSRRSAELQALYETVEQLNVETSVEALLARIVETARGLAGATYAALGVVDAAGRLAHFIPVGVDAETVRRIGALPQGRGLLGLVLREGKAVRVADIAQDPRAAGFPPHHPPMRSFMGVPIATKERIVGNLYLTDKRGGEPFTAEDENLLLAFASQAAVAIEKARLLESQRRAAAQMEALYRAGRDLLAAVTTADVVGRLTTAMRQGLGFDRGWVALVDPGGARLVGRGGFGEGLAPEALRAEIPLGPEARHPAAVALREERPLLVTDPRGDPRWADARAAYAALGIEACGVVPILGGERPLGIIAVGYHGRRREIGEEDLELLTAFANLAAIALERAALYEQARRTADDLRDLNRFRDEMLSALSHDMRGPLTSIEVALGSLQAGGWDPGEMRDLAGAAQRSATRLTGMVNDLLDVSRIEGGRVELYETPFDLADVLRAEVEEAALRAREKDIRLALDGASGPIPMLADQAKLARVLSNLLGNALKYTPGGGAVRVTARVVRPEVGTGRGASADGGRAEGPCPGAVEGRAGGEAGPWAEIRVEDTGPGIRPEEAERVFQKFYRIDAAERARGGLGLGLFICKGFVEAHGGRIWVEGPGLDGSGSRFVVRLPLRGPGAVPGAGRREGQHEDDPDHRR
jgi:GAF domain-containing protein/HAMP domain-containing protein